MRFFETVVVFAIAEAAVAGIITILRYFPLVGPRWLVIFWLYHLRYTSLSWKAILERWKIIVVKNS